MAEQRKLGRPTAQRTALLRGQVTELLWNGKIETTYARAKEVAKIAEKLLTAAINTYTDTVKKVETRKNDKGQDIKVELVNDGAKKLAARRKIMAYVYDLQEQRKEKETKANFKARTENIRHPLIEKIFNEYAPKYAQRGKEKGQMGGYTRVIKMGNRVGDAAEVAIIELV
ncbi:MAG: 50S ribosomal protein L17 [Clostridia bacterium]|nr:50S ribosomal protein L17 [Clostridia bacterium]